MFDGFTLYGTLDVVLPMTWVVVLVPIQAHVDVDCTPDGRDL